MSNNKYESCAICGITYDLVFFISSSMTNTIFGHTIARNNTNFTRLCFCITCSFIIGNKIREAKEEYDSMKIQKDSLDKLEEIYESIMTLSRNRM